MGKPAKAGQSGATGRQLGEVAVLPASEGPEAVKGRGRRGKGRPKKDASRSTFIQKLDELVTPEEIIEAGCRLGAIKRQRVVDLPALVEATIAAMSPIPGAETSALVNYLSITGVPLVPSSFYDRFSEPFAELMQELAGRALRAVREVSPIDRCLDEYGVLLERFSDIRVGDSTCHLLKRLATDWAPSTSKKRPAGVKFHTVVSLVDGLPIAGEVTTQRTHDNKAFPEETLAPGTLSLFDLGYIDVGRFVDAIHRGAHFLTRLKESHDPEIVRVHQGSGSPREARGLRISQALGSGVLDVTTRKGVIDLDVKLRAGEREAVARVVAIEEDESGERHWYLTTIDRETLCPTDVAQAYRLRWEIELIFKQLKSGAGLSAILAWRASAVLAFLYAKIVGLCLARLLEISVEERHGRHATTQLALMLTLSRSMPLLLGIFMQRRGITLQQLEDRIIMIARIVARSRNQRRERAKRKRQAALGRSGA